MAFNILKHTKPIETDFNNLHRQIIISKKKADSEIKKLQDKVKKLEQA